MLTKQDFVLSSLKLNLFFLRIMKEHFIFLQASLFPKNKALMAEAHLFQNKLEKLLKQTLLLSEGILNYNELQSNEYVTPFTLEAEKATQYATGLPIDTQITVMETSKVPTKNKQNAAALKSSSLPLEDQVFRLNENIISALTAVIQAKTKVYEDVAACKLFTNTYPSLLEHVLHEAAEYSELLNKLQRGTEINTQEDLIDNEKFWNHVMLSHSYFIRGLVDPSEKALFDIANTFSKEFELLMQETTDPSKLSAGLAALTERTIRATTALRDFKAQATQGLLSCKIKAIILPLLADHVMREANYYLNVLAESK